MKISYIKKNLYMLSKDLLLIISIVFYNYYKNYFRNRGKLIDVIYFYLLKIG